MSVKNLKIKKITIIGVIPSFAFQRAKHYAFELHKNLPQRYPLPEVRGMLEFDWNEKLQEWKRTMDRDFWCIRRPVVVFFDDKYIGNDVDLLRITSFGDTYYENIPRKNMCAIKQDMKDDYYTYLKKSKLYSDILPKTCKNFKDLCLGPYKRSLLHRVVKNGWVQGGKIEDNVKHFEDENYSISHDRRGIISMVSNGKNRIKSEFFITLNPTPWLDRYYVAFGQLVEGLEALEAIENVETFYENPLPKIEIKNCGELIFEEEKMEEIPQKIKKSKRIETMAEQLTRMMMEAVTDALSRKEYPTDVLDERDVPSEMDLQLYFQGFYSIPFDIVEEVAQYLREVQRNYLRYLQPEAMGIADNLVSNILNAVLTNLTTLDDVRATLGKTLYEKLMKELNTELESAENSQVQQFVEQLILTAKKIINVIGRKLDFLRKNSKAYRKFQEAIDDWLSNFVLQKSFLIFFLPEKKAEVEEKKVEEKKVEEKKRETKTEEIEVERDEICGGKINTTEEEDQTPLKLTSADFFSDCRYQLKYVNKLKKKSLVDLIEACREDLRLLRNQADENPIKDPGLEKKLTKYLTGILYRPETEWIRDLVFDKDDKINHADEILCGSLTIALLEMYYLYEEYLMTRDDEEIPGEPEPEKIKSKPKVVRPKKKFPKPKKVKEEVEETGSLPPPFPPSEVPEITEEEEAAKAEEVEEKSNLQLEPELKPIPCKPCECRDSVCDCTCDPNWSPEDEIPEETEIDKTGSLPPPPPPSEVPESTEGEGNVQATDLEESLCPPGYTPMYLESLLADEVPEPIDFKSFEWLEEYILTQGCETKSKLAQQVHDWLNGGDFNYSGFLSKHSLATRASLLSLSFSMASLIRENNEFKTELRNFIYDLWWLYFEELFKETYLQMGDENVEGDVERSLAPYVSPSWIKVMLGLTKKALQEISKTNALPNATTKSEIAFEENMKTWFDSEKFQQAEPSGKDIIEYISYYKVSLENLDDTVRSYLKSKMYSGLMNKDRRKSSANELANGVIMDVIGNAIEQSNVPSSSVKKIVSEIISTAVKEISRDA